MWDGRDCIHGDARKSLLDAIEDLIRIEGRTTEDLGVGQVVGQRSRLHVHAMDPKDGCSGWCGGSWYGLDIEPQEYAIGSVSQVRALRLPGDKQFSSLLWSFEGGKHLSPNRGGHPLVADLQLTSVLFDIG